jgi:gas vesicle protein
MKVFVILLITALAAAAGLLFGTDKGRQCKNDVLARARKSTDAAVDAVKDTAEVAGDVVQDTMDRLTA